MICTTHEDIEKEIKHLKDLSSKKVDGVILMSAYRADGSMDEKYIWIDHDSGIEDCYSHKKEDQTKREKNVDLAAVRFGS